MGFEKVNIVNEIYEKKLEEKKLNEDNKKIEWIKELHPPYKIHNPPI